MSPLASDHQQQQGSMSTLASRAESPVRLMVAVCGNQAEGSMSIMASRAESPVMLMVAVCGDRAQELARPQLYLGDQ